MAQSNDYIELCRNYQKGRCAKGKSCKYLHATKEQLHRFQHQLQCENQNQQESNYNPNDNLNYNSNNNSNIANRVVELQYKQDQILKDEQKLNARNGYQTYNSQQVKQLRDMNSKLPDYKGSKLFHQEVISITVASRSMQETVENFQSVGASATITFKQFTKQNSENIISAVTRSISSIIEATDITDTNMITYLLTILEDPYGKDNNQDNSDKSSIKSSENNGDDISDDNDYNDYNNYPGRD